MKKEGNKKMPTPRQKVIHNPIPTSLFLSRPYPFYVGLDDDMHNNVWHNELSNFT